MSMTLCHKCGCLCDTDAYPEGYYRQTEDGGADEPSDEYYCETCNQGDW